MTEKIDVNPTVLKCLELLREAVNALPEGEVKTKAEGALAYLESAARGEPQLDERLACPSDIPLIPTGD
jgi:hypothetical protein